MPTDAPMETSQAHYPVVTKPEKIADGVMHALGTTLSIVGVVILLVVVSGVRPGAEVASVWVYGSTLIASFIASTCYHMTPWEHLRPQLLRYDHAAIFLKIAGTYTPLMALIGSVLSWTVLAAVWTVALMGALLRLFSVHTPGRFLTLLFLALGWAGVVMFWPLAQSVPPVTTVLVVVGGVLYTAGTVFVHFGWKRYQNAIWHAFVLAASTCFFVAIAWSMTADTCLAEPVTVLGPDLNAAIETALPPCP